MYVSGVCACLYECKFNFIFFLATFAFAAVRHLPPPLDISEASFNCRKFLRKVKQYTNM